MLKKKEILMKSFFNAQFNYCSLTWMLHSRRNNNIIHSKKIKFFIKDFFSKCDQIRRKLRIWSHLLKKSLMENFIFCAVIRNLHERCLRLLIYNDKKSSYEDLLTKDVSVSMHHRNIQPLATEFYKIKMDFRQNYLLTFLLLKLSLIII